LTAHPTAKKKSARCLRTGAPGLCLLAGLFAIAMAVRPEVGSVLAQASSPQVDSPQESTSPAPETGAQNDAVEPAAKADTRALSPASPPGHRIADDSAYMLKLANRLKVEVDNTTVDTLSITAIRDVQEIEKLAHKMRTQ